jgi:hypothetical protein
MCITLREGDSREGTKGKRDIQGYTPRPAKKNQIQTTRKEKSREKASYSQGA